ncbi:MAG: ribosomal protein L7/L12, partial [Symploca sp. SIO1C4]|nr:ribosomal protein L7/L12 [Symploca sp. SIO1C4]
QEPENATVEVILETFPPDDNISVIKLIHQFTKLRIKEAKDLTESTPSVIKKTTKSEADEIKKQFEEVGATVSLKADS